MVIGFARAESTAVDISPLSTFAREPVDVTLTTTNPTAVIRYTLDGSDPDTNSPAYAGAVTLGASAEIRAAAFVDGVAGPISNAIYTISTNAPNILLFVAEDLGMGDLHHYGNPVHATPNFDALGRTGVRFTQVYCTGPSNAPNQYAALTGRLLPRSGLPPFLPPGSTNGMAAREWTLGEAFLKAGYHTAFIGGWHLGDAAGSLPHHQGFELFHGLIMPLEGSPLADLRENDSSLEASPNPTNLLGQFVTRALEFLNSNATNQFLLVLQVPPLPTSGDSLGGEYGNRVEALDHALGQITDKLDELGVRNETLLVCTSDEGPDLTVPLPHGSAGLFRDGRGTTFEGGVRIPAFADWPGTILPGAVSQAMWWLPDMPPTLCAIAGLPWPQDRLMDGLNRAAALTGAALRPNGTEQLFFHRLTSGAANLAAQRLGALKFHRSITRTDPENSYTTPGLLFDIERDPAERFLGLPWIATNALAINAAASAHLATFQPPYPQLPDMSALLEEFHSVPTEGHPPLQLQFRRAGDSLDEYYRLEESTNLLAWSATSLTGLTRQVVVLPDGAEEITFSPAPPAPGTPQVFYRLRLDLP